MYKEELLEKLRVNTRIQYDMPMTELEGIAYDDTVEQFIEMSRNVRSNVIVAKQGESLDDIVRRAYPEAKVIASDLKELTIAALNPDTVADVPISSPVSASVKAS